MNFKFLGVQNVAVKEKEKKYYSSDEEQYEIAHEPLINVLSFGWMEDGRCGYPPNKDALQLCARPITMPPAKDNKRFICRMVAAGSRHAVLLMINCRREEGNLSKKTRKVCLVGLNQLGLCEEPGYTTLTDVRFLGNDKDEIPVAVAAGSGTSFVVTKIGNVFSFGVGRYGVLGHGDDISIQTPRQILSLSRHRVQSIAAGHAHALCVTYQGRLLAWGRNRVGQCGHGTEGQDVMIPRLIEHFDYKIDTGLLVSCGMEHSLALVSSISKDLTIRQAVYAWGHNGYGQLGSGDAVKRMFPQENRWLSKYCRRNEFEIEAIAAGGYHNLVLTKGAGQVISWGAGQYGQCGNGYTWVANPRPVMINNLKNICKIAAGLRHSMALRSASPNEIYAWGYNAYGECGLGDVNIRLQPTMITGLQRARATDISCGDRHSMVRTNHQPMVASEEPQLKPYFGILSQVSVSYMVKKQLRRDLANKGMDPDLLNDPLAVVKDQPGSNLTEVLPELFEKGLRYCLDSLVDPSDWRRKTYETCYECTTLKLTSVCMSCARHCLFAQKLRPYIRRRSVGNNLCDCILSGLCQCYYSQLRGLFDALCGRDKCIAPKQVRQLLHNCRQPSPVDQAEIEECLVTLADAIEDADTPRIHPMAFENWYREFYQENGDERQMFALAYLKASKVGKKKKLKVQG